MSHSSGNPIILLGDYGTVAHRAELAEDAAKRGYSIVDAFGFDEGAAADEHDLTQVEAVVAALGRAITRRMDIWVPFLGSDFRREQHMRRLSLVLQRHGLNLLVYRQLYQVPVDGGINEIDQVLRLEVQAVDDLDYAALASAGGQRLSREIALALGKATTPAVRRPAEAGRGGGHPVPPALPPPTVPWPQRKRLLKRYAGWLVYGCGVTQTATARVLNSAGQRTPTGRPWKPGTVSKLLTGKYDESRHPGDLTPDARAG